MYQAQDTFVAEINGSPLLVQKGTVWSSGHPVVKLDAGRDVLFRRLETEEEAPAPARRPRATARKGASADDTNGEA